MDMEHISQVLCQPLVLVCIHHHNYVIWQAHFDAIAAYIQLW